MVDEAALLKAITDSPNDEAPRLAYADWCDQQQDSRGGFIRYQLALAAMDPSDPDVVRLYTESQELLAEHGEVWTESISPLVSDYTFHRGFVERVTVPAAAFLTNQARLFKNAPILHLDITELADAEGGIAALLACPGLGRLQSLSFAGCGLEDGDVAQLAECEQLSTLKWLSLADNDISLVGAQALARSDKLTALRYIAFDGNRVDLTERVAADQGVIIEAWLPEDAQALEEQYGRIPWLHSGAEHTRDHPLSRYRV